MTKLDSSKLIFICGCPRSGTSWTWAQLTSVPGVKPLLIEDFPDMKTNSGVKKMKIGDKWRTTETTIFFSNLTDDQIVRSVERRLKKSPKSFLVEKTPSNILRLERIIRLFPEAKIIHVVRDPRANINSLEKTQFSTGFKFATTLEGAVDLYRKHFEAGQSHKNYKNLIQISYEDLHLRPEKTLKRVLSFCGIDNINDAEIKEVIANNHKKPPSVQKNLLRVGEIDSYKKELSKKQISYIEKEVGHAFKALGYRRSLSSILFG